LLWLIAVGARKETPEHGAAFRGRHASVDFGAAGELRICKKLDRAPSVAYIGDC